MLQNILSSLEPDEKVTIHLSRDKKGAGLLILTAEVDFDPDEKDDVLRQLLASMARPLVIRLDKDDDPDQVLTEAASSFSTQQRSSRDTLRDYRADQVSGRAVAQSAPAKKAEAKPDKKAAPDESNNPAPAPTAADENPDSLL